MKAKTVGTVRERERERESNNLVKLEFICYAKKLEKKESKNIEKIKRIECYRTSKQKKLKMLYDTLSFL